MYTVTVSHDITEVPAFVWNDLVAETRASVFYRHEFLYAYQASNLGSVGSIVYLTVPDGGGALIGALPAYLLDAEETGRVLGIQALDDNPRPVLLSHLPHCYDTIIPVRNDAPDALEALWSALLAEGRRCGAGAIGLMNVGESSATRAAAERLPGVSVSPGTARWILNVPEYDSLDAFIATMSRTTRRTLRLARNRALRAGVQLDVTRYHSSANGSPIDDVVELCVATAAKHGSRYYPHAALRAFLLTYDDFIVIRVRLGGQTLAASICFVDDDVLHVWAGGARYPAELNWSANYVLFYTELELGFRLGLRRIECGRRNDAFKARHRLDKERLVTCLAPVA